MSIQIETATAGRVLVVKNAMKKAGYKFENLNFSDEKRLYLLTFKKKKPEQEKVDNLFEPDSEQTAEEGKALTRCIDNGIGGHSVKDIIEKHGCNHLETNSAFNEMDTVKEHEAKKRGAFDGVSVPFDHLNIKGSALKMLRSLPFNARYCAKYDGRCAGIDCDLDCKKCSIHLFVKEFIEINTELLKKFTS